MGPQEPRPFCYSPIGVAPIGGYQRRWVAEFPVWNGFFPVFGWASGKRAIEAMDWVVKHRCSSLFFESRRFQRKSNSRGGPRKSWRAELKGFKNKGRVSSFGGHLGCFSKRWVLFQEPSRQINVSSGGEMNVAGTKKPFFYRLAMQRKWLADNVGMFALSTFRRIWVDWVNDRRGARSSRDQPRAGASLDQGTDPPRRVWRHLPFPFASPFPVPPIRKFLRGRPGSTESDKPSTLSWDWQQGL
jgi:hypothetical protein